MLIGQADKFEYTQGNFSVTCFVTGESWKENAYIVTEMSTCSTLIVDPGDHPELIINHVQDHGGKVIHILLTHPHHDHVGAAAQLSNYYNVPCQLHRLDVRLLMHAPMYALRFANKKILPVSFYQDFEDFCSDADEPKMRSIHTPGHTRGSVCYVFDGFVMTGDTLLYKHVGRMDLPGSSIEEMKESVNNLLSRLSDEVLIFPGHGKPWTIGEAKSWWQERKAVFTIHNKFCQL